MSDQGDGQFAWLERNRPPYDLPKEMKLLPEEMTALGRQIGGIGLRESDLSGVGVIVEPDAPFSQDNS